MPSAKEEGEESPGHDADEDAPDWTTWLRSRLERVSTSERTAAESAGAAPAPTEGNDRAQPEAPAAPQSPAADDTGSSESVPGAERGSDNELPGWDSGPEEARWAPASQSPVIKPVEAPTPPDASLVVEMEALRAAVTTLVAGVGTLSDTFSGFRDVVNDRLRDYSETVLRLSEGTAAEVEEYHQQQAASTADLRRNDAEINERLQSLADGMESLADLRRNDAEINERLQGLADGMESLADLRRNDAEINERLQRLGDGMESLAELRRNDAAEIDQRLQPMIDGMERLAVMRGDDERWAEVMGRLLDEVDAERQASEREALTAGGVVERLDGLEQALRGVAAEVSDGMGRLLDEVDAERQASEREALTAGGVVERLDGLEQALHRVAEEVSELTAAQRSLAEMVPPPPAPPSPAPKPEEPQPSVARPRTRPRGGRTAPLRADRRTSR